MIENILPTKPQSVFRQQSALLINIVLILLRKKEDIKHYNEGIIFLSQSVIMGKKLP